MHTYMYTREKGIEGRCHAKEGGDGVEEKKREEDREGRTEEGERRRKKISSSSPLCTHVHVQEVRFTSPRDRMVFQREKERGERETKKLFSPMIDSYLSHTKERCERKKMHEHYERERDQEDKRQSEKSKRDKERREWEREWRKWPKKWKRGKKGKTVCERGDGTEER